MTGNLGGLARMLKGGLDFGEFMTCIEGDAIDFQSYVKGLPGPALDRVDNKALAELEAFFAGAGTADTVIFTHQKDELHA